MFDAFSQFHFLRPWGLLVALFGIMLVPFDRWLNRRRDAASRLIAPHLMPHLLLAPEAAGRFRPIHGFSALLIFGGLAISGPTWEKALPPFADDHTRVTVIVDLSDSMGGPQGNSTLELAKARIDTLARRHPGWHIGLVGYGQSAHLVLPSSRDTDLLSLYLNSLQPGMVPGSGRNLSAALNIPATTSAEDEEPTSVIVLTDNLAASYANPAPPTQSRSTDLLILAPAEALSSAAAQQALETLSARAHPFSSHDVDVQWLERHVQSHFTSHQGLDNGLKWRDSGYWLVWPALFISLLSIRKGWHVQWCVVVLALFAVPAPQATAGPVADAFLTPDQQGRLAFESERYAEASRLFSDPYLKGLSAYRASDFEAAITHFRRQDTGEAWFYLGNSYARTMRFDKAIVAYETALKKQADFPEARANLALVKRLSEALDQDREHTSDIGADDIRFDKKSDDGAATEIQSRSKPSDELWLQNLSTSATEFLKRKFAAEQRAQEGERP